MSQRAIKKRDNPTTSPITAATAAGARQTLFKKAATTTTTVPTTSTATCLTATTVSVNSPKHHKLPSINITASKVSAPWHKLQEQSKLLGRATHSNPELRHLTDTLECFAVQHARTLLARTKSESDIGVLVKSCTGNAADLTGCGLIGAKSEVCLQTISSHSYQTTTTSSQQTLSHSSPQQQQTQSQQFLSLQQQPASSGDNMLSRSHRDLSESSYSVRCDNNVAVSPTRRRLSECSLNSSAAYSQRTSVMSSSAFTLSSTVPAVDPNAVLRVPIIGYEVMEERARFTVYKLRVEHPVTHDCWLVLRRYTDFVRLNTKLKQAFPHVTLMLPRKKIFGDNFNSVFLDNRVQGLQMFVNSIMANEQLRKFKMVREFFCLDEPPTYSESMEECRAIFEAQEETIAHLKLQINSKNDLILSLQHKIREEMLEKDHLNETIRNLAKSTTCAHCTAANTNVGSMK